MGRKVLLTSVVLSICIIYSADVYAARAREINTHGIELTKQKKYTSAIKEFDRAIHLYNEESAQTYHNKGWAYELIGDMKSALECYEEAFRRNPAQIISGEKLGFLYYQMGDYDNAVRVGETVLKYDSKNREVTKWLPDAYVKKLQSKQEKLEADKLKEEAERKKKLEQQRLEAEKKAMEKRIIYGSLDFMIRTGYYFAGEKGYKYISTNSTGVDVPQRLFIAFEPVESWQFTFEMGNPYLGALMPDVLLYNEKIEGRYTLGNFMLGLGGWITHNNSNQTFIKENTTVSHQLSESDFKVGIIFGYMTKKSTLDISFYPRVLPHNGSSDTGDSFDVDSLEIRYTYIMNSVFRYYSIITAKDFYIFNHQIDVSNYWGVYDIGVGVTLGSISSKTNRKSMAFTIEYRERLYCEDLNNKDPYSLLPNGQGWLGMNKSKWLKGDPFSGFNAFGHVLSIKVEELVNSYISLYQQFIFEMGDLDKDHHEFNLLLGVGASY